MVELQPQEKSPVQKGGEVVQHNPTRNSEGYFDPTAYLGTKDLVKEENQLERMNRELIHTFRKIADLAGFEIVGRITLRDKKTRREFR